MKCDDCAYKESKGIICEERRLQNEIYELSESIKKDEDAPGEAKRIAGFILDRNKPISKCEDYRPKDVQTNLDYIVKKGFDSAEHARRALRYFGLRSGDILRGPYCDELCPHADKKTIDAATCEQCEIDYLNSPYDGYIDFDEWEKE